MFIGVCTKAPFASSTEKCIEEVVTDCKEQLDTQKDCEKCVLLHSPDLKKSNCTTVDIAAVEGLCTQIDDDDGPAPPPAPTPTTPTPAPGPGPAPGKSHYEDPKGGCQADEQAVQITGVQGSFCSPDCASAACPTDVPDGVTAAPQCALKSSTGTDKKCALICNPSGDDAQCGENASCKSIQTVGICTYDDGSLVSALNTTLTL